MFRHVITFAIDTAFLCSLSAVSLCSVARAVDSSPATEPSAAQVRGEQLFREQVLPILVENCRKCHNSEKSHGSLNFDSRESVLAGGESHKKIVEVPIEQNELWRRVNSTDRMERMPLEAAPLSPENLDVIRQWAEAGAPWPADPAAANRVDLDSSRPLWVRAFLWLEPASRYLTRFSAYAPAGYLLLAVLCIAAIAERWKQLSKQRGKLLKPWQSMLCRVATRGFYAAAGGAIIACMLLLHIRVLTRLNAALDAARESLAQELAFERQVTPPQTNGEPFVYFPPSQKQLGGVYYRGNDERNDALFNGGRYRTCTFTVALCNSQRKPLAVGDAVPPGQLFVKLEIQRAPFAAESLFSKNVIDATFITSLKPQEKISDASKQLIKFATTLEGERWEAFVPIAEVTSAALTENLAGTLYLYNGGRGEETLQGAVSYAIRYNLNLNAGKLAPDCDLRMGVSFIPGNFAVPRPTTDSIGEWFDLRPLPEIVRGNTKDPALLGVEPHEERLGPLEVSPPTASEN